MIDKNKRKTKKKVEVKKWTTNNMRSSKGDHLFTSSFSERREKGM
jgi:hypothetical protein